MKIGYQQILYRIQFKIVLNIKTLEAYNKVYTPHTQYLTLYRVVNTITGFCVLLTFLNMLDILLLFLLLLHLFFISFFMFCFYILSFNFFSSSVLCLHFYFITSFAFCIFNFLLFSFQHYFY